MVCDKSVDCCYAFSFSYDMGYQEAKSADYGNADRVIGQYQLVDSLVVSLSHAYLFVRLLKIVLIKML